MTKTPANCMIFSWGRRFLLPAAGLMLAGTLTAADCHFPCTSPGRIQGIPPPNELAGVSTVSPSDTWTVGDYHTCTEQATMTLHWNGTNWTQY